MSRRQLLALGLAGSAAAAYWYRSNLATASTGSHDSSAATSGADQDRLKLVQVVFRHGARTPLTNKYWEGNQWETGSICGKIPGTLQLALHNADDGGPRPVSESDKKQESRVLPGGCTCGELTLKGQQQSREFGEWLRQRYVDQLHLLPPEYQENAVSGRTTNFRRTISTISNVLTGLYPSASAPIPIATAGDCEEMLFPNAKACERLGQLMTLATTALKEETSQDPQVQHLEEQVRAAMSLPAEEAVAFTDLHDAMTTLLTHGKPIPEGMRPLLPATEAEATKRMAALVAPFGPKAERLLLRLSMGQLLQKIMEALDAAARDECKSQMYLYSGHDTTIMPLLVTLGVPLDHWPGYVSHVIYELWERPASNGSQAPQHYVKVLHHRQPMAVTGHPAGEAIELEEFKRQFLQPFAITREEFMHQCQPRVDDRQLPPTERAAGDSVQGL